MGSALSGVRTGGGTGVPLTSDPANVSYPHTLAERTSALEAEGASMRVRMERLEQMIGRTVAGLATGGTTSHAE